MSKMGRNSVKKCSKTYLLNCFSIPSTDVAGRKGERCVVKAIVFEDRRGSRGGGSFRDEPDWIHYREMVVVAVASLY